MKIVILDRKTLGYDIDVSVFEKFGNVISFDITKPDETKERIKDADIILTNKVYVGKEELENSKVKLICITATGTNNVDLIYEKEERNGSLRGAFGGGRFGSVRTIGASDPAYGAYTDYI